MIASTGSVAVHHDGNDASYSVLGCMLLLAATLTSVSVSLILCDCKYVCMFS